MNKLNQGILVAVVGLSSACIREEDSCIAEGTMIRVPSGLVPIESLRVGDLVFALDLSTNVLVKTSITEIRSAKRECVAAGLGGGDRLRCTPTHPLYDPEQGVYAPASEWIEGRRSRLLRVPPDGSPHEINVQGEIVHAGVFEVFDLSVESEHHNYVAAGVLVHNKTFDDTLDPGLTMSGTSSGTDSTGDQSSTGGDTTGEPTGSSSGTAGSSSGTTGSTSGSGGSDSGTGSSGTSGSSGAAGGAP